MIEQLQDKVSTLENFKKINKSIDVANRVRPANRVVLFGDSLTEQNRGGYELDTGGTTSDLNNAALGHFNWARGFASSEFVLVANEGEGGDRTDDMLARLDDVLAHDADIVIMCAGRNDISQAVTTFEDFESNMDSMVSTMVDRGIRVILLNVTPQKIIEGSDALEFRGRINRWYSQAPMNYRGVYSIDIEKLVVDYSDGTYVLGGWRDGTDPGTHWSVTTACKIGVELAKVLDAINSSGSGKEFYPATSPLNISRDPLLLNAGSIWAEGEDLSNDPLATVSFEPSEYYVGTNKAVVTIDTGPTGYSYIRIQETTGPFTEGDRIKVRVEYEWDVDSAPAVDSNFGPSVWFRETTAGFNNYILYSDANSAKDMTENITNTGRGVWETGIYTVPATVPDIYVYLGFRGLGSGSYTIQKYMLMKVED